MKYLYTFCRQNTYDDVPSLFEQADHTDNKNFKQDISIELQAYNDDGQVYNSQAPCLINNFEGQSMAGTRRNQFESIQCQMNIELLGLDSDNLPAGNTEDQDQATIVAAVSDTDCDVSINVPHDCLNDSDFAPNRPNIQLASTISLHNFPLNGQTQGSSGFTLQNGKDWNSIVQDTAPETSEGTHGIVIEAHDATQRGFAKNKTLLSASDVIKRFAGSCEDPESFSESQGGGHSQQRVVVNHDVEDSANTSNRSHLGTMESDEESNQLPPESECNTEVKLMSDLSANLPITCALCRHQPSGSKQEMVAEGGAFTKSMESRLNEFYDVYESMNCSTCSHGNNKNCTNNAIETEGSEDFNTYTELKQKTVEIKDESGESRDSNVSSMIKKFDRVTVGEEVTRQKTPLHIEIRPYRDPWAQISPRLAHLYKQYWDVHTGTSGGQDEEIDQDNDKMTKEQRSDEYNDYDNEQHDKAVTQTADKETNTQVKSLRNKSRKLETNNGGVTVTENSDVGPPTEPSTLAVLSAKAGTEEDQSLPTAIQPPRAATTTIGNTRITYM